MGALIRRHNVWHLLILAGPPRLGRSGGLRHGDVSLDPGANGPRVGGKTRTAARLAGRPRVE
eukprot:7148516-Alexandrium_andersonii.AAC.1